MGCSDSKLAARATASQTSRAPQSIDEPPACAPEDVRVSMAGPGSLGVDKPGLAIRTSNPAKGNVQEPSGSQQTSSITGYQAGDKAGSGDRPSRSGHASINDTDQLSAVRPRGARDSLDSRGNLSSTSSIHQRMSAERAAASARSSFACEVATPGNKKVPDGWQVARGSPKHAALSGVICSGGTGAESPVASRVKALEAVGLPNGAGNSPRRSRTFSSSGAAADPLPGFTAPSGLAVQYMRLGVLPHDTPVPLSVLQRLWGGSLQEVFVVAHAMAAAGALRLATLDDGSVWALAAPQHLAHMIAIAGTELTKVHVDLLNSYTANGTVRITDIADDGYIIQALTHHLLLAEWDQALADVLMEPLWLEHKLHAYGIGAIVADYRRFLTSAEDSVVKLLLQAFHLSLAASSEHPALHLLREQMLCRLMVVSQAGPLQAWYEQQHASCCADAMLSPSGVLLHMLTRTPSLTQAGGVHRMTLRGHAGAVRKVLISPNGKDIVTISDDGTSQLWDMNVGDCVLQLEHGIPLSAAAVTPDGRSVVLGAADGSACVWDLVTGTVPHSLPGHTERINALAVDRQGLRALSASADRTARVWSLFSGTCEAVLAGHGDKSAGRLGNVLDVCISLDGALAVTASDDASLGVWDMDDLEGGAHVASRMHALEGHGGSVLACVFVGATHHVISASADCTARIWHALKGTCLHVLSGHTGSINRIAVDPAGTIAITVSDDTHARVWHMDSGTCLHTLTGHSSWLSDAVISRDGSQVVTACGDGKAALWDVSSGQHLLWLEGHGQEIRSLALSARGRFVVTASDDSTARLWDLQAAVITPPPGHEGRVLCLAPLPGGLRVASTGEDGRVMLWDPATGELLARVVGHRAGARYMRVSQQGAVTLTGSGDRKVVKWDWTSALQQAAAHQADARADLQGSSMSGPNAIPGGASSVSSMQVLLNDSRCARNPGSGSCGGSAAPAPTIPPSGISGDGRPNAAAGGGGGGGGKAAVSGTQAHSLAQAMRSVGHESSTSTAVISGVLLGGERDSNNSSACTGSDQHFSLECASGAPAPIGPVASGIKALYTQQHQSEHTRPSQQPSQQQHGVAGALGVETSGASSSSGSGLVRVEVSGKGYGATGRRGSGKSDLEGADCSTLLEGLGYKKAMASVSSTGRRDGSMDSTASKLSLYQLNDALLSHRKSVEAGQQAAAKPYQRSRFSMESVRSAGSALARLCAAPVFMDSVLATRASLPEQQGSRVKAMAFDAACKLAAVLLFDSTVSVWDVETGALKAALIKKGDLVKSDAARSISQSLLFQSTGSVGLGPGSTGGVGGGSGRGHSAGVNGVLLTHDGSKAVTFAKDNTACIWDVATCSCLHVVEGHTEGITAATISEDQTLLATTGYDKSVRLSMLATGAPVAVLDHAASGTALSFSPDSSHLAVVLEDDSVVVWDLVNRSGLPPLAAHRAAINACVWSPDGHFLATASQDCTLRVWRISDGAPQAFFMADAALSTACFAGAPPSADIIVAGDVNGTLHFLDFLPEIQQRS